MPHRPYIVGNWKMNGLRAAMTEARAIDRGAQRHPGVRVGIAPPFTLVHAMAEAAQALFVGGQDCHAKPSGAFTGEISAPMLKDAGATFTILGHSERRAMHGETDAVVKDKADAALAAGLDVIVCVGETEGERDAGFHPTSGVHACDVIAFEHDPATRCSMRAGDRPHQR